MPWSWRASKTSTDCSPRSCWYLWWCSLAGWGRKACRRATVGWRIVIEPSGCHSGFHSAFITVSCPKTYHPQFTSTFLGSWSLQRACCAILRTGRCSTQSILLSRRSTISHSTANGKDRQGAPQSTDLAWSHRRLPCRERTGISTKSSSLLPLCSHKWLTTQRQMQ